MRTDCSAKLFEFEAAELIFNSWNLQRIGSTDKSALGKRLGTTFPLIAGWGGVRRRRVDALSGAERRRRRVRRGSPRGAAPSAGERLLSCSVSVSESRSARTSDQEPFSALSPAAAGLASYFAIGHASECFGFIRDWVEKKIRRHMVRSRKRKGFGWTRWSRQRLYEILWLFNGYRVRRPDQQLFQQDRSHKLWGENYRRA